MVPAIKYEMIKFVYKWLELGKLLFLRRLFSNERHNGGGSGWKRRYRGKGKRRGRRNHNQNIVCEKKKIYFQ